MLENIFLSDRRWQELNPVQCGQESCAPAHSYGPAVREYYLLHYVLSGKGRFYTRGTERTLCAGQIFVIRPFERTYYEADGAEPWHYIWIGFETALPLPQALEEDVISCPEAGPIFTAMAGAGKLSSGREAYLCGQLWLLLSLLTRESGEERPCGSEYVRQALNRMQTNYMEHISVSELAAQLGLDRSYFSTLFRRQTGQSPQQYLTALRMEKAALLLREYGYSPGEAALAVGYPDIFSFSRMFKRKYGVCPSRYAQ